MWRCAPYVHRDRKAVTVRYRHDLGPLPALGLTNPFAPLLGWCKAAVDEGFCEDLKYAF